MRKTILVATDFSDEAFFALKHAIGLAKYLDARLVVLHAHHDLPVALPEGSIFSSHFDAIGTESRLQHLIADKIEKLLEEIEVGSIDVEISVYPGSAIQGILELSERISPAYVIIGRTGLSKFEHMITTSCGEKLVRHCNKTVITIAEETDVLSKSILVPLDFGPTGKNQMEELRRLPLAPDAVIHILSVVPAPSGIWSQLVGDSLTDKALAKVRNDTRKRLDQVVELISDLNRKVALHMREGRACQEILRVADSIKCDTVLIGSIGRSGLAHLLIGNTAEKVMQNFTRRMIIVHHESKSKSKSK